MKTKLTGNDVCLETSLKEYGLAWIERESEYRFYYGVKHNGTDYTRFDWVWIAKGKDPKEEWDWIKPEDWQSVFSMCGMDESEWMELPLPYQVSDLIGYFGAENIFGGTYWEGMTYPEVRFQANRIGWKVKA